MVENYSKTKKEFIWLSIMVLNQNMFLTLQQQLFEYIIKNKGMLKKYYETDCRKTYIETIISVHFYGCLDKDFDNRLSTFESYFNLTISFIVKLFKQKMYKNLENNAKLVNTINREQFSAE